MEAIEFGAYAGIAVAVIVAAERIARITPTKTDDRIVKFVRKLAQALSLDLPDNPGKEK